MIPANRQATVWGEHAQQWSQVGTPLKPSPEDIELTSRAVQPILDTHRSSCRVIVLGVTPELVHLPWPSSVELYAFDHSAQMIQRLWQPPPSVSASVLQADWRQLPLPPQSVHLAVGDGSLNALPRFADYTTALNEVHRVLAPEGLLVLRCFVRPTIGEALHEIATAVSRHEVGSFHALKWRIAMSLASDQGASVAVQDIFSAFHATFPSRQQLAAITGWPEAQINTIDAYRNAATRFTFPSQAELAAHCHPYFEIVNLRRAGYELADRCPTVTLRPQAH